MRRRSAGWTGRLRRSGVLRALLARLGAGYLRLAYATTRWRRLGSEDLRAVDVRPGAFIAAFWHGRLALSPLLVPAGRTGVAMISSNRDGALIAAIAARFGAEAVRGSSFDRRKGRDKGGGAAYRAARAALEREDVVLGVTPDGPRGPRMHAAPGVARLSVASGAPVLPVAFSLRGGVLVGSWDRFLLPLPFGRGAIVYGPALEAPGSQDEAAIEHHRAAIERALIAVTTEADRACRRTPVTPA